MKEELIALANYMECICRLWKEDQGYVTLTVVLRNMAFRGELLEEGFEVVKAMSKLSRNHVVDDMLDRLDSIRIAEECGAYDEEEEPINNINNEK